MIVFQTNPDRAFQALLYLAMRRRMRLEEAMWALLTADALHLNRNRRPVTGDLWDAAPFGPVPRFLRDLLDGRPSSVNLLRPASGILFRPCAAMLTVRDGLLSTEPIAERASLTPGELLPDISRSDRAAIDDPVERTAASAEMMSRVKDVWRDRLPGTIRYEDLLIDWSIAEIADLAEDSRQTVM